VAAQSLLHWCEHEAGRRDEPSRVADVVVAEQIDRAGGRREAFVAGSIDEARVPERPAVCIPMTIKDTVLGIIVIWVLNHAVRGRRVFTGEE